MEETPDADEPLEENQAVSHPVGEPCIDENAEDPCLEK